MQKWVKQTGKRVWNGVGGEWYHISAESQK